MRFLAAVVIAALLVAGTMTLVQKLVNKMYPPADNRRVTWIQGGTHEKTDR